MSRSVNALLGGFLRGCGWELGRVVVRELANQARRQATPALTQRVPPRLRPEMRVVSEKSIQEAHAELVQADAIWQQYGYVKVPPEALQRNKALIRARRSDLDKWDASVAHVRREVRRYRHEYRCEQIWLGCIAVSQSYYKVTCVALVGLLLSIILGGVGWYVAGRALGLLTGFISFCVCQMPTIGLVAVREELKLRTAGAQRELGLLGHRIAQIESAMLLWEGAQSRCATQLRAAEQQREHLRRLRGYQENHDRALAAWQESCRFVGRQEFDLLNGGWRGLRGVKFEDFLFRVLGLLGYACEKTKQTGDQGVDLIATGKGRKIAIQAKGYSNSVGNWAIQQVHAGKSLYGCDLCVVITNSYFTGPARDLARAVGCQLISGQEIPALITGKLPLTNVRHP